MSLRTTLEVKRLVQALAIIGDLPIRQTNIESECLMVNLQMNDCRKGCVNCHANDLFAKLERAYDMKDFDQGKKITRIAIKRVRDTIKGFFRGKN